MMAEAEAEEEWGAGILADADPAGTGPMVEFTRIWRDMPKRVLPDAGAGRLEHDR